MVEENLFDAAIGEHARQAEGTGSVTSGLIALRLIAIGDERVSVGIAKKVGKSQD